MLVPNYHHPFIRAITFNEVATAIRTAVVYHINATYFRSHLRNHAENMLGDFVTWNDSGNGGGHV